MVGGAPAAAAAVPNPAALGPAAPAAVLPTTWTVLQQDGPNHLGLWCNLPPEHQTALITCRIAMCRSPQSCSTDWARGGSALWRPELWPLRSARRPVVPKSGADETFVPGVVPVQPGCSAAGRDGSVRCC